MKFLVTGSLQKKKGPKLIISFAAIYILSFLVVKFILGIKTFGNHESAIQFFHESSLAIILEEIHAELFYSGLIFLFTGSVIRELFSQKYRYVLLYMLIGSGLLYIFLLILSAYFHFLIPLFILLFYFAYIFQAIMQVLIISKLNLPV